MLRLNQAAAWLGVAVVVAGCGGASRHDANGDAQGGGGASGSATLGAGTAGITGGVASTNIDSFETADLFVSIGLWMGFPGNTLPIGMPPTPHDGSALHLSGETDAAGLDVFFHTAQPVERIWSSVRFWIQSDLPGSELTVAVAGPEPSYFSDRALGVAWPERTIAPSRDWREVTVKFADMGIGPNRLSPHSEMFGAVHFLIEPQTKYDLWIDEFVGEPLYP